MHGRNKPFLINHNTLNVLDRNTIILLDYKQVCCCIFNLRLLGAGGGDGDDYEATGDVDIKDSGKELTVIQRLVLFFDAPRITFRHNVVGLEFGMRVCVLGRKMCVMEGVC